MAVSADDLIEFIADQGLASGDEIERIKRHAAGDPTRLLQHVVEKGILTSWQANEIKKRKRTLTLGKYLILDELPEQSEGRVFLARHRQMDRQV